MSVVLIDQILTSLSLNSELRSSTALFFFMFLKPLIILVVKNTFIKQKCLEPTTSITPILLNF